MMRKHGPALYRSLEEVRCDASRVRLHGQIARSHLVYDPPVCFTSAREGFNASLMLLWRAFPDLRMELEEPVVQGERVVQRRLLRGTHQGAFLGVAPTGRPLCIRQTIISRVVGSMVLEEWVETDLLGFLEQVGEFAGWN
jgi:predicted ester cyclase